MRSRLWSSLSLRQEMISPRSRGKNPRRVTGTVEFFHLWLSRYTAWVKEAGFSSLHSCLPLLPTYMCRTHAFMTKGYEVNSAISSQELGKPCGPYELRVPPSLLTWLPGDRRRGWATSEVQAQTCIPYTSTHHTRAGHTTLHHACRPGDINRHERSRLWDDV